MQNYKSNIINTGYNKRFFQLKNSLDRNRNIAMVVTLATIIVAFTNSGLSHYIFITFFVLLLLQTFSISQYRSLEIVSRSLGLLSINIFPNRVKSSIIRATALSVKEIYFYIFLCFDCAWLIQKYIFPTPAKNLGDYLNHLQIGTISGETFLIFTLVFWFSYLSLFIISASCEYNREISAPKLLGDMPIDDSSICTDPRRVELSILIKTFDNKSINLNVLRMRNKDKQPLILWPGFFQNGYVYDLLPGKESLAEYLWKKEFDIWIIHSRGTGGSGGKCVNSNLDDYAATDIPQVIEFIFQNTGKTPIYIGHSQGGITAIMSMMGAQKDKFGKVSLNNNCAAKRQNYLKGLVTIGSFPDFVFSKPSILQDFVDNGFQVKLFKKKIRVLNTKFLLRCLSILKYIPLPILRSFRIALLNKMYLKILFWPFYFFIIVIARSGIWKFLYQFSNVNSAAQDYLFCKTFDGTYYGILNQFRLAVKNKKMKSADSNVNYSENYDRITLPVSFVAMEYDPLADPVTMKKLMFEKVSSKKKYFMEWKGQGHEDFFMNSDYFENTFNAIQAIHNNKM